LIGEKLPLKVTCVHKSIDDLKKIVQQVKSDVDSEKNRFILPL
jgi:hypothetical protein